MCECCYMLHVISFVVRSFGGQYLREFVLQSPELRVHCNNVLRTNNPLTAMTGRTSKYTSEILFNPIS